MITVHVVMHAHLDPIWMWPWTSGMDEALATARSACDRLDAHPDLFYTQGEAWTFSLIERSDPALFRRVAAHVAAGRWEVVNGWWTQPDCNLPSALGLRRQIEVGLRYVADRFGLRPRCGFNPDTFGHCAVLPEVLRDCGQDRYVFMRPSPHERQLPGRLFRWRAAAGGQPVTTLRTGNYINRGDLGQIRQDLGDLPAGSAHALTLAGLGDHGGGPTERLIAWVREHVDAIPGAKLVFSTVDRFFAAIEAQDLELPEVEGELQMHAIGCYTVARAVKTGVRRAEEALARAEAVALPADAARLDEAWRQVASHHFHDTLGGTCLPSANVHVVDQLGAAAATGEEVLQFGLRRRMSALPDDHRPRAVLCNPDAEAFSGWCEIEPYVEGRWTAPWRLVDERGEEVPFQALETEAAIDPAWPWGKRRCLLRAEIPAGGMRSLHLDLSVPRTPPASRVTAARDAIASDTGAGVRVGPAGMTLLRGGTDAGTIALALIADPSDTWSHACDRYGEVGVGATWSPARVVDAGPLMASLVVDGRIGASALRAEWRVHAGDAAVDLILDIAWAERRRVLKLVLPNAGGTHRVDATPGMGLRRANDGVERPLAGWTALPGFGVVCPDVFALDCANARARLTLLRSPLMACHDPNPGDTVRSTWSDQGTHRFRFRFLVGDPDPAELARQTRALLRPPVMAELTRGMGPWDG